MPGLPEYLKDYFNFTRRERSGIFALLFLIVVAAILPAIWPTSKERPVSAAEKRALEELVSTIRAPNEDSAGAAFERRPVFKERYPAEPAATGPLFYFDPNTANEAEWRRLGVRDKTIVTIGKYRSHGGRFTKAEDLSRVYGLRKNEYERLLPWVRIRETGKPKTTNEYPQPKYEKPAADRRTVTSIDINNADSAGWVALPGIGPALAGRILRFRERLGGFYTVEQVGETWGLPDSVFQLIRPRLHSNSPVVRQLDINTADANTLRQHPYLRWNMANAIVQYRNQHGHFQSVDDLLRIAVFDKVSLDKIRPYLLAGPPKKE